jgi:hypothetical protein
MTELRARISVASRQYIPCEKVLILPTIQTTESVSRAMAEHSNVSVPDATVAHSCHANSQLSYSLPQISFDPELFSHLHSKFFPDLHSEICPHFHKFALNLKIFLHSPYPK